MCACRLWHTLVKKSKELPGAGSFPQAVELIGNLAGAGLRGEASEDSDGGRRFSVSRLMQLQWLMWASENVVSTAELFDCEPLVDLLWGFTSEYAAFCEAGPFLPLVFPPAFEILLGVMVGAVQRLLDAGIWMGAGARVSGAAPGH